MCKLAGQILCVEGKGLREERKNQPNTSLNETVLEEIADALEGVGRFRIRVLEKGA